METCKPGNSDLQIKTMNRRRKRAAVLLLLAFVLAGAGVCAAQGKRKKAVVPVQSEKAAAANEFARLREEFIKASKEYKASVEKLLVFHENNVRKAEERLTRIKELHGAGLISKRELEAQEQAVADASAKVLEARQQIASADTQIAGALVEAQAQEQMAKAPPVPAGRLVRTTSYIRYNARGGWSLSEAWRVQRFFLEKFGRQLPISAFGQSAVHDRWRYDHRNALDVPLNPDSPEGQALLAFLRSNGIPFSAFRGAIPGTATGPHIHVGQPSHKF